MKLTLLLTLKGRPRHTLRWLWHAERTALPFRVMISDGGDDEGIARALSRPELFPNLQYTYHRYQDVDLPAYWFKVVDSIERIDTPYVMMVDNDDFVIPSGLMRSLEVLDADSGLVWANGTVPSFDIDDEVGPWEFVLGAPHVIANQHYPEAELGGASPMERVTAHFRSAVSIHYSVFRTEVLLDLQRMFQRLDFRNHDIADWYKGICASAMGRAAYDSSYMVYVRQLRTSSTQASLLGYDMAHRLYHWGWMEDYRKTMDDLVAVLAKQEGRPPDEFRDQVDAMGLARLRRIIAGKRPDGAPNPLVARLRQTLKRSAAIRRTRYGSSRKRLFKELAGHGTSPALLAAQAADLDAIEATLGGEGFDDFVRRVAPEYACAP